MFTKVKGFISLTEHWTFWRLFYGTKHVTSDLVFVHFRQSFLTSENAPVSIKDPSSHWHRVDMSCDQLNHRVMFLRLVLFGGFLEVLGGRVSNISQEIKEKSDIRLKSAHRLGITALEICYVLKPMVEVHSGSACDTLFIKWRDKSKTNYNTSILNYQSI